MILIADYEDVEWLQSIREEVAEVLDSAGYEVSAVGVLELDDEDWAEQIVSIRPTTNVYLPGDEP